MRIKTALRRKPTHEIVKVTCSLAAIESSVATSLAVDPAGDACNARKSTLSPAMGATCGRREREAGAGNGRSQILHEPAVASVEGTLVHGMPSAFAGWRKSVGLGRSDTTFRGSSLGDARTDDNRCPLEE